MTDQPLQHARVGVSGARQGVELVRALEAMGASVTWGPTVEAAGVPTERLRAETAAAVAVGPSWVVVTTAPGIDRWVADAGDLRPDLVGLLRTLPIAARSHRAAAACVAHGCPPALVAPSERTSEIVDLLPPRAPAGSTVVAQVDGCGSPALVEGLEQAGLSVLTVRPHRWEVPSDVAPAQRLVREIVARTLDVIVFTGPPAVDGLFEIAADLGMAAEMAEALTGDDGDEERDCPPAGRELGREGGRVVVAVIGASTAEAVERRRVPVAVLPLRPRTDALLAALATAWCLPRQPLPVQLDAAARAAVVDGRTASLSDLEFALLASLARRQGATCPTSVLMRELWGDEGERRRLEVLVSRLRARVQPLGIGIAAVPKRGYRLERAS